MDRCESNRPGTDLDGPQRRFDNDSHREATFLISRLIRLLDDFAGQRVLLVGDFWLDRYVSGDAGRISPEASVPVLRKVAQEERPGGAGSVAAHLSAIQLKPLCVGVIGNDAPGDRLAELLTAANADIDGLRRVDHRSTPVRTRLVGLAQHRHPQQLLRVDEDDAQPWTEDDLNALARAVEKRIDRVDLVCAQDGGMGSVSESVAQRIIAAATSANKAVLIDPISGSDFQKYAGATVLTPNRAEFLAATGHRSEDLETFDGPARELRSTLNLQWLVVTLDRDGVLVVGENDQVVHVPTRPRAVYDNAGAGDAVLAALAATVAAGGTIEEAAHVANFAGGLEIEQFGNVPVSKNALTAEIRSAAGPPGKVRTESELLEELSLRKGRGETVVFTNGCFDVLHPGHTELLTRAKEQGDVLVVAVNSDASVKMNKGPDRPIWNEEVRAKMIGALESVDFVTVFETETPLPLIEKVIPDVLIKGGDYDGGWVCGREFVEGSGGKVVLIPFVKGFSTTGLVERIREGEPERSS
jgi:D-beta-D-heptose 7-phosphate kinase/D-beta-D-heptose 1-phosphate adenosyltransferase